MNKLTKIVWCIPGVILAALYFVLTLVFGVIGAITTIPFGHQYWKLTKLCFNPFDAKVGDLTANPTKRATRNVIFNVLFGIVFTAITAVFGLVCCVTIIGFPAGINCFKKIVPVALKPFNYAVV